MKVKIVNRVMRTSDVDDMISFQLMYYMFINGKRYNASETRCLVLLAKNSDIRQADFCNMCVEAGIYTSGQSARNFISKAVSDGTIVRDEDKRLKMHEDVIIRVDGNVLFNLKFLYEQ